MSIENNPPVVNISLSTAVDITITLQENLMLTFTAAGTFRIPGPYKGNFFPPLPDGVAFTAGQSWPSTPVGAKPLSNDSVGYTYGNTADPSLTGMKTIKTGSGATVITPEHGTVTAGFTGMKTIKAGS